MSPNNNVRSASNLSTAGRVPPNNCDAEAAVLAAVLLSTEALGMVRDILKPAHFYSDANSFIYETCLTLADKGTPIDIITVAEALRATNRLPSVGGASYLTQLADATPAVAHVAAHAKTVVDHARLRWMIAACQRIAAEGYGEVGDVDTFLDAAETAIHAVANDSRIDAAPPTLNDAMRDAINTMLSNAPTKPGITTGLADVDKLLGPMLPGDLVYVAAHSGVGKTSLGMQLVTVASNQTTSHGPDMRRNGVLCFSVEMTRAQLGTRSALSMLSIDTSAGSRGKLTDENKWALDGLDRKLATSLAFQNVWIRDVPNLTPSMIRREARRVFALAKRQGTPLACIMVDYIQLLDADAPEGRAGDERRERQLAKVSGALKALAKELGVVCVVLAQLNEDARTSNRLPRGEDLKECKAMRADADKLLLLHNPSAIARRGERRMGAAADREVAPEVVDIIVDKNRGGVEGRVAVVFHPALSTFADITPAQLARHIEQENAADARARASKGSR